jgi:hypothetical protein
MNPQRIAYRDLTGRRAELIVVGDHGRVVLVTASGETAVLTPCQAGKLRAALRDALLTQDVYALHSGMSAHAASKAWLDRNLADHPHL